MTFFIAVQDTSPGSSTTTSTSWGDFFSPELLILFIIVPVAIAFGIQVCLSLYFIFFHSKLIIFLTVKVAKCDQMCNII